MPGPDESLEADHQSLPFPWRWFRKPINFLWSFVLVRKTIEFLWSQWLFRVPVSLLWALVPWAGLCVLLSLTTVVTAKPHVEGWEFWCGAFGSVLTVAAAASLLCWQVEFSWDCLFAVLVSVHLLVLHLLVGADWWHPTTASVKSLFFGYMFAGAVLAIGLLIRLFKRQLKVGQVCYCLVLSWHAYLLWLVINEQWGAG